MLKRYIKIENGTVSFESLALFPPVDGCIEIVGCDVVLFESSFDGQNFIKDGKIIFSLNYNISNAQ